MFGRKNRRPSPQVPSLGIGALVQVVNDGRGDQWDGEPIGVIVAPGSAIVGYPGIGEAVAWTVAFDEPAYTTDGRGPYEHATVSSRQLVALEHDQED